MANNEMVGGAPMQDTSTSGRVKMLAADAPEVVERFHAELELVNIIARQTARTIGKGVDLDDLLSAGREGLLDAARRFDASRGIPFRAYANFRVRGAVVDGIRQMAALPRRAHERLAAMEAASAVSEGEAEFAFAKSTATMSDQEVEECLDEHLAVMATAAAIGLVAGASEDDAQQDASLDSDPEEAFARAETMVTVRAALAELSAVERQIVTRHYLDAEGMGSIAEDLNVSKSWISRVHTRAIARLSKKLEGLAQP